jgi:AcrR family transcriptional regulator
MAHENGNNGSTRARLLDAAGVVFAEKGFHKATVRDIVGRAEANLNAVNYHFGDKTGLYLAVMEHAHRMIDRDCDLVRAGDPSLSSSLRLEAFIRFFLKRALSDVQQPHIGRLMGMEMSEPTAALDMVVERFIRPRFLLLVSIVRDILGEHPPQENVELCAESIVGQCLHLMHGRPIVTRLMPHMTYTADNIEVLVRHITTFSLAALDHLNVTSGNAR